MQRWSVVAFIVCVTILSCCADAISVSSPDPDPAAVNSDAKPVRQGVLTLLHDSVKQGNAVIKEQLKDSMTNIKDLLQGKDAYLDERISDVLARSKVQDDQLKENLDEDIAWLKETLTKGLNYVKDELEEEDVKTNEELTKLKAKAFGKRPCGSKQSKSSAVKFNLRQQMTNIQSELKTHQETLQYTQADLQATQADLNTTRADLQTTQADLQTTRADLQTTQADFQTSQADLQTTRAELQTTRTDLQTIQADLQTSQADLQTTRAELQTTRAELQTIQAELQTSQADLQITWDNLHTTRTDLQITQADLQTTQADLQTNHADHQTIQADLQTTRADLQSTKADLQSTQADLQTTQSDLQTTRADFQTIQADLQTTQQKIKSSEEALRETSQRLLEEQQAFTTLKAQLQTAEQAIRSLKVKMDRLRSSPDLVSLEMGSTFTRWGRTTCPDDTALVYSGYVGGQNWLHAGGGSNYLCVVMPPYLDNMTIPGRYNKLYGAEYESIEGQDNQDAVCSVCRAPQVTTLMIPGTPSCPPGWTIQYRGHLVSGEPVLHKGRYEFVCLDEVREHREGGQKDKMGAAEFFHVVFDCGPLPCPPYVDNMVVTCVVCSM